MNRPMLSHKMNRPMLSHKMNRPMLSHKMNRPMLSHKMNRPMLSHKMNRPMLSHKMNRPMLSHKMNRLMLSCKPKISLSQIRTFTPELEFTTTERGGKSLIEKGYSYTRHRSKGDILQWQCVQRSVCNARLHTKGQIVVRRINEHNHEINPFVFHCSRVKAGMKRKASTTQEGTHSILTSSLIDLTEDSATHLPKLASLKQTIRRARNKSINVPPESASLELLEIPEAYMITNKGKHFLLFDSGTVNGYQRILIFGTEHNIEVLNTSKHLDGRWDIKESSKP